MFSLSRARWLGITLIVSITLLLGLGAAPSDTGPPGSNGAEVPGRYIVVLGPGTGAEAVAADHGLRIEERFSAVFNGFAAVGAPGKLRALRADPRVRIVEPDRVVTAFDQTLPTGVNRIDADLSPTAKIDRVDERVNVDIAVIDTGVQKDHPDLNVAGGYNCTNSNRSAWGDGNGHGTHVAGTAAAKDNGIGVVGVAPGARLWAVRVLGNNGSGFLSWVICGVDWVTANSTTIEVTNMSLGFEGTSAALDDAIGKSVAKGVTYAVAAGNSAKDAATFSPANHPAVIAVSAIADFNGVGGGGAPATCRPDVDDTFADFSNFGSVVDIAAPGVCIRSTYTKSGYATLSGTSMASPHVAGAAGLVKAKNPDYTPAQVRDALLAAAKPQSDPSFGFTGDPDSSAEPLVYAGGF